MSSQLETTPILPDQLVDEVKGIYKDIVSFNNQCDEIRKQLSQTTDGFSDEQLQALTNLHGTLLHKHYDFLMASQHPVASAALRRLPTKHDMLERMWTHSIHSCLELLRRLLPRSIEHMISFIYLTYPMMGLLIELAPVFCEPLIRCLGDLARYRMAIEEYDMQDRENWSSAARMWYHRAADLSPTEGRIQHHLAVLAKPNVVRQLFYYTKALVSDDPFVEARGSIMYLFSPFLKKYEATSQKHLRVETSLVTAAGVLFTRDYVSAYCMHIDRYLLELSGTIDRAGSSFKSQGAEMASSLIAMMLDFGSDENFLWKALCENSKETKKDQVEEASTSFSGLNNLEHSATAGERHRRFWQQDKPADARDFLQSAPPAGSRPGKFSSSNEVTSYVLPVWHKCVSIVAAKRGARNTAPFLHYTLAFLWGLSYVPETLIYIENFVPWEEIVRSLNAISRSGVSDEEVESPSFPQHQSGTGRQLPEDFLMRGFKWSCRHYYPPQFFEGQVTDVDDRTLELPSHVAPRAARCLWLGVRLATLDRYITYDFEEKQFSVLPLLVMCRQSDVMDED
ncbi:hypothetical protein, variant [Exophiala oligosperma]|nr:hypothetical protein, variant [Exophiala oligosperma]KIW36536.1 hypothetical protein, variant [Exophiala oligosperma]